MRFLVVGTGSMGKRRTRVLQQLGQHDIIAFDNRPDRRAEIEEKHKVKTYASFEQAMAQKPDVLLICAPPHLHAQYVKLGFEQINHIFCEAPLVLKLEDFDRIDALAHKPGRVLFPSCTYLHNCYNLRVKELINQGKFGKPLALIIHSGLHVQDWHPYEDYKSFYAAHRDQGGMCIDILVHEFQLARFLVGEVTEISCFARRRASVEGTTGFDIYDILAGFESGVSGIIHNDMVQRPWGLYRKIMGEQGGAIWDWYRLQIHTRATGGWADEKAPESWGFESMYASEMSNFIDVIEGRSDFVYPLGDERRVLELMLAAEKSSQEGKHVAIEFGSKSQSR